MNTLRENTNTLNHSPSGSPSTTCEMDTSVTTVTTSNGKPKTPLRKDELEKLAKELKKKLSKASITAKQSLSPTAMRTNNPNQSPNHSTTSSSNASVMTKTSPLKYYMIKNKFGGSPSTNLLSSSPNLYSPNGKSPTQMKTSAALFLSSSPLKGVALSTSDLPDSPIRKKSLPLKNNGLQATPPSKLDSALKPSPSLTSSKKDEQTTPTLSKRQLDSANPNALLKTPTQSRQNSGNNYNDEEGADLLMYLATSPSPAKPYYKSKETNLLTKQSSHKPTSSAGGSGSSSNFLAPPPLTPKRHINNSLTKTPQNRLTPSVNLFNTLNNNGSTGLPSSGLTLTPAGFSMSDYVFFTPSPGSAAAGHHANGSLGILNNKNFLKTPDFNNIINNAGKKEPQGVDGKMINFDRVGFNENKEQDQE